MKLVIYCHLYSHLLAHSSAFSKTAGKEENLVELMCTTFVKCMQASWHVIRTAARPCAIHAFDSKVRIVKMGRIVLSLERWSTGMWQET